MDYQLSRPGHHGGLKYKINVLAGDYFIDKHGLDVGADCVEN
jgi:hypothetical protein